MIRKLIHFSDTHEAAALENWRAFFDKRIVGFLNSRVIRKARYDRSRIAPAVAMMLAEKPDAIFFTGDAVSCGQPGEFARALPFFEPILNSRIPFFYTPGNHDAYVKDSACAEAFRNFTRTMTRGQAGPEDYPFAVDLEGFRVILLNCARPTALVSSCGFLPEKAKAFLKKEAERFKTKPVICAGHFPILERMPVRRFRHRLYGARGDFRRLPDEIRLLLAHSLRYGKRHLHAGARPGRKRVKKVTFGFFPLFDWREGCSGCRLRRECPLQNKELDDE